MQVIRVRKTSSELNTTNEVSLQLFHTCGSVFPGTVSLWYKALLVSLQGEKVLTSLYAESNVDETWRAFKEENRRKR